MTQPPANPKIYHITHVDNLPNIIAQGGLWSDREMIDQELDVNTVGLSDIKERRLEELDVDCNPGTKVGDYVPFYLCPRSVMLSVFWYDNIPELTYHEGQEPIVHLQADMNKCVKWAKKNDVMFAFSDMNAGMRAAEFFNKKSKLKRIDWDVVNGTDFSTRMKKHKKAAEFLIHEWFPWELIDYVGVFDKNRRKLVKKAIKAAEHQPKIGVEPSWYF